MDVLGGGRGVRMRIVYGRCDFLLIFFWVEL